MHRFRLFITSVALSLLFVSVSDAGCGGKAARQARRAARQQYRFAACAAPGASYASYGYVSYYRGVSVAPGAFQVPSAQCSGASCQAR